MFILVVHAVMKGYDNNLEVLLDKNKDHMLLYL